MFFGGWLLGYSPAINTWHKADLVDVCFRSLILPPCLGLFSWLLLCALSMILGQRIKSVRGFALRSKSELINWIRTVPARWPFFVAVCLLGLISYQQYSASQSAKDHLLNYLLPRCDKSRQGFIATRHPLGNWCTPSLDSGIIPRINFSSARHPKYNTSNFNMRYLGLVQLKEKRKVSFKLTCDDGAVLLIDGIRRINLLGRHPVLNQLETAELGSGWHSLELLYFQAGGGAEIKLALPPDVLEGLKPVTGELDLRKLWRLNRTAEITRNRSGLLFWISCVLSTLLLMPYPASRGHGLIRWIGSHLNLLILLSLSAILLVFRLEVFPGLKGDEALVGDSGFSQYWYGIAAANISDWAWSDFSAKLILNLQKVFWLSVGNVRMISAVFNITGLLMCALAVERLVTKRAALIMVLLVGTAPWFLGFGRLTLELLLTSMFILGGSLLGLALARRTVWGGVLIGAFLGFGLIIHVWWLHLAAGLGTAAFFMLRGKLLRSKSFWATAAVFIAVGHTALFKLISGNMHNPTGDIDLLRTAIVGLNSLKELPDIISGKMVLLHFNGQLAVPIYPLVPLLILALVFVWPFAKTGTRHRQVLQWTGLACCGGFICLSVISPWIRDYYYMIIAALIFLWSAVFIDCLWERGVRKIALAIMVVMAVYGGGIYLINGPFNYNPPIKEAYQTERSDPARNYWNNSQNYFFKHELYAALAKLGRSFSVLSLSLRAPLWFLERTDTVGRYGLLMADYKKDSVLLLYSQMNRHSPATLTKRSMIESAGPVGLRPLALPANLADKYKAYIILKDMKI